MEKIELIERKKVIEIVIYLHNHKGCSASELSYDIRTSWSYICNILKDLESLGLLKRTKSGRKSINKLTATGEEIAKVFSELMILLKK